MEIGGGMRFVFFGSTLMTNKSLPLTLLMNFKVSFQNLRALSRVNYSTVSLVGFLKIPSELGKIVLSLFPLCAGAAAIVQ